MNSIMLSEEKLAGQRLVVGFKGQTFDNELRYLIGELHVGGLIIFKRNAVNPQQLGDLCHTAQAYAAEAGNPQLIISIDQEGGPVARLGPPFAVFKGIKAIGHANSHEMATEFGVISARELKGVGITMNHAPVLDVVPYDLENGIMADRVFGHDPELVSSLGATIIDSLQNNGVAATAKHFPGIGRTILDSHIDLPSLETPKEILESTDFVPFKVAIEHNVASIMLSHIIYKDLDPVWPASLSKIIAKDLLRDEMGFQGVVMTDDLEMGAVDGRFKLETMVERIVETEIDIALICHDRDKIEEAYSTFLQLTRSSEQAKLLMKTSIERILRLKELFPWLGSSKPL